MISEPLPGSKRDMASTHRMLPASLECEKGVISSILLEPTRVLDEIGDIPLDIFHHPSHVTIYQKIVGMFRSGKPIDLVTVTQELADAQLLDAIGGPVVLAELHNFLPTAASSQYYLDILREKHAQRSIISTCERLIQTAYEEQTRTADDMLEEAESALMRLRNHTKTDLSLRHIAPAALEAIEGIEFTYKNMGKTTGLCTGIPDLDRMTGGLHGNQMIVIAARPSMGKTALALLLADNICAHAPAAMFSLEMNQKELATRLICMKAKLNLQRVRDGFLKRNAWAPLMQVVDGVQRMPFYVDDTPSLSVYDFRSRARRAVLKYGCKAIIIDYLQLMRSTTRRAQENRALEVTEISQNIKACAKELDVPVIALAQLGRDADRRSGPPKLSDLRESGSIEQDADVVMMLWRKPSRDDDGEETEKAGTETDLIMAKQRNGPAGAEVVVKLNFLKEFALFEPATKELYSNNSEKRQQGYAKAKPASQPNLVESDD